MAKLFFFIERDDGAIAAFENDGVSVPFYTDRAAATRAVQEWAGSGAGVGMFPSRQAQAFGESCNRAGARTLQMDVPLAELKNRRVVYLDLARARVSPVLDQNGS